MLNLQALPSNFLPYELSVVRGAKGRSEHTYKAQGAVHRMTGDCNLKCESGERTQRIEQERYSQCCSSWDRKLWIRRLTSCKQITLHGSEHWNLNQAILCISSSCSKCLQGALEYVTNIPRLPSQNRLWTSDHVQS